MLEEQNLKKFVYDLITETEYSRNQELSLLQYIKELEQEKEKLKEKLYNIENHLLYLTEIIKKMKKADIIIYLMELVSKNKFLNI
jgi:hypothetical protein